MRFVETSHFMYLICLKSSAILRAQDNCKSHLEHNDNATSLIENRTALEYGKIEKVKSALNHKNIYYSPTRSQKTYRMKKTDAVKKKLDDISNYVNYVRAILCKANLLNLKQVCAVKKFERSGSFNEDFFRANQF